MTLSGSVPVNIKRVDFVMSNSYNSALSVPTASLVITKMSMLEKYVALDCVIEFSLVVNNRIVKLRRHKESLEQFD